MARSLPFFPLCSFLLLFLISVPGTRAQTWVNIGGSSPTNSPQNFDGLGNSPAPLNTDASNITVLNASAPRRYLGKFDNARSDSGGTVNVPG